MTHGQRTAVVDTLVALASDRSTFDKAVDSLVEEHDGPACYPLLRRGDRTRWRGEDWINFVWACSSVGDFATAVSLESTIPPSLFFDPDLAHLMRANLIWAHCHLSPAPSRDELLSFINEMSSAVQHWRERAPTVGRPEVANRHQAFSHAVAAKCHMMLGQLDAAAATFEAAAGTHAGLRPLAALLWGDLLAAQGDRSGARAKWAIAAKSQQAAYGGFLGREIALRDLDETSDSG
jgi:hypothetical protein